MATVRESDVIQGVYLVSLTSNEDERGRFVETFRKEWFPQRPWDIVQGNASYSKAGVLRGLHYHHHQADYWFVVSGGILAGLCDLRRSSPTHRAAQAVEIGERAPTGLYLPPGVAHGFLALTDVVLTYLVDNYYDGTDEHGVAWDDPDIGIDWGTTEPGISPRDASNPSLKSIPADRLPP